MRGTRKLRLTKKELSSGDGMLTTVWGPAMWHFLHTMSFNYPVDPTPEQQAQYLTFLTTLPHVLPCRHCRDNLAKTFKLRAYTPTLATMKSRATLSKYVYELHEKVNRMLKKKSGLTYRDVQARYENFRARCTRGTVKRGEPEKGCTEPLHRDAKAKCVLKFVPQDETCDTFQIDPKCTLRRV